MCSELRKSVSAISRSIKACCVLLDSTPWGRVTYNEEEARKYLIEIKVRGEIIHKLERYSKTREEPKLAKRGSDRERKCAKA